MDDCCGERQTQTRFVLLALISWLTAMPAAAGDGQTRRQGERHGMLELTAAIEGVPAHVRRHVRMSDASPV